MDRVSVLVVVVAGGAGGLEGRNRLNGGWAFKVAGFWMLMVVLTGRLEGSDLLSDGWAGKVAGLLGGRALALVMVGPAVVVEEMEMVVEVAEVKEEVLEDCDEGDPGSGFVKMEVGGR